jgi:hypothetical protein
LPAASWVPTSCQPLPLIPDQQAGLAADGTGWRLARTLPTQILVAQLDSVGTQVGGEITVLTAGTEVGFPTAVSGPGGVVVSGWLDSSNTLSLGVTQVSGATFSAPDSFLNGKQSPLGMAANSDAVELTWCDGTPHAVQFSDAGTLSAATALSSMPGCLTNPTVAFDGQRFVAIWAQAVDAGLSKIVGAELTAAGVPNGAAFDVSSAYALFGSPQIAALAPGRFGVLYTVQAPPPFSLNFELLSYGAGPIGAACTFAADCASFVCAGSRCATADGGVPDGGLPDAGLPDAGLPDGGLLDAGAFMTSDGGTPPGPDAGMAPDAGVNPRDGGLELPDGGLLLPDGGVPPAASPRDLTVACGCDGSSWVPSVFMLALSLRMIRRRENRGKQSSRARVSRGHFTPPE